MFERFTDRARKIIVLGQEAARVHRSDNIDVEHLVIGIIDEAEGLACKVLEAEGVDLPALRTDLAALIGPAGDRAPRHIPFTPRAKKTLELALRAALELGHSYIGTEHVLLGILKEGDSQAAKLLERAGVTELQAKKQVVAFSNTGRAARQGDLTAPSGDPYPQIVQNFIRTIEDNVRAAEFPELRDRLIQALEIVAEERARQARSALAQRVRADLALLADLVPEDD